MFWKFLFVIYALVILAMEVLGFTSLTAEPAAEVSNVNALINVIVDVILVFAMIYTFALGWKRRLVSEKWNKIFFWFSLVAFLICGVFLYREIYSPLYSDLLLTGMENGMVPRNWDFQLLLAMTRIEALAFVSVMMFFFFAPFYLAYYHYSKRMNLLGSAKHVGRKCFAVYCITSYLFAFISMFLGVSGDVMNFNVFDCFSILSTIYISLGLIGYAFNQEFLNQEFWRITLPVCVVIEMLPPSFFSSDFKNLVGMNVVLQSPVYVISGYLMTAIAIFMIYQYSNTDMAFQTAVDENKTI